VFIGALVFGGLIAWSLGRLALRTTKGREGAAVLLWSWLLVPISTMFLVSAFTPLDFYSPRYYVSGAPAGAALFGWAVSCIHPAQARRVIGVAFAILAVMTARGSLKVGQDWRGLAEAERVFANDHTLVLMHPVFIEARQLDWLDDPERRSYLLAPTSFYPMEGDMVAMPYAADESGLAYLARLEAEIDDRDRILLVTQSENRAPFRTWLDARLGPDGWTSRSVGRFGLIELFEFTRGEGAPPTG